uniref:Uncharacterized protein n=1 Tax=Lotharella globosa TaxID=91324 RepID=A0A7S3YHQ1_9EUKA
MGRRGLSRYRFKTSDMKARKPKTAWMAISKELSTRVQPSIGWPPTVSILRATSAPIVSVPVCIKCCDATSITAAPWSFMSHDRGPPQKWNTVSDKDEEELGTI